MTRSWPAVGVMLVVACAPTVLWSGRSSDGSRRARVVMDGSRQRVIVDGVEHEAHDVIGIEGVRFAGARLLYPARDGETWRLIDEGVPGPDFVALGEVWVGPAARHAYFGHDGQSWWVLVDGRRHGPYEDLFADAFAFSRDGLRFAWVAEESGRAQVVVDGLRGPIFDGVARLSFATDGRALYLGRTDGAAHLVVDHEPGPPYSQIRELVVGERVGYVAEGPAGWHVIVEGEPSEAHEAIRDLRLDENQVAYVARHEGRDALVVNGAVVSTHDRIGALELRATGPVVSVREERRWYVIADRRHGPYDRVERIETRANRWGAIVRTAEGHVRAIADGEVLGTEATIADFVLRGTTSAYLTERDGLTFVVVDREAYPMRSVVRGSLVLTDDGRRWGCVARGEDDDDGLWVVLDGSEMRPFDVQELVSALSGTDLLELTERARELVQQRVAAELAL